MEHTPDWTMHMIAHATNEAAVTGRDNERSTFIIRAVNSHDELLEAAKDALIDLESEYPEKWHSVLKLREVIAKAEGRE